MKRVGLIPHRDRPAAHELARHIAERLVAGGVEVALRDVEAAAAGLDALAVGPHFDDSLDLAIAIGGDGTMLHTFQLVYTSGTPILGVNVGQLGYLTALEPDEVDEALPGLLEGRFDVSERAVVEVSVTSAGSAQGRWYALNEAVLEKVGAGHAVRLEVAINDEPFTTYAADGLIVATPTGTTAYTFSVRGPIVSPDLRCLVLTPVSPHMLFDRSLVLAPSEPLTVVVDGARPVGLTLDGRELGVMLPGESVRVRTADEPARLVARAGLGFHDLLKTKFRLPDR